LEPKGHDMKTFDYLSMSGKPSANEERTLLERWFSIYPEQERSELRRRMESKEQEFYSAFFELFLYASLKQMGAAVQIHPDVSDEILKHPDFLVCLPSGYEFYLEAVVASGQSDEERSAVNAKNAFYASLDRKLQSPDYFWSVTIHSQGKSSPSAKQVVHGLREYQKTLNIRDVITEFEEKGFDTPCRYVWNHDGWLVHFVPIPKAEDARGKPESRPLGSFHMPKAICCDDDEDIRTSVKFKIKHHGEVDKPYMIAVAATGDFAEQEDFMNAIYGTVVYEMNTKTGEGRNVRQGDGVWSGDDGPKNNHLVAVLGAWKLFPYSIPRANVVIFENPYIDPVGDLAALDFPHWLRNGSKPEYRPGRSPGEIHGLDPKWPSFEA